MSDSGREWPSEMTREKDDCELCHGTKGGVKGNENLVDGVVMCDYCHVERLNQTPTNQPKPAPTAPREYVIPDEECLPKYFKEPAPTAEEQLPPYDERYVELTEDLGSEELDADVKIRLAHDCRERQLLAALRSNREKDAQLADYKEVLADKRRLAREIDVAMHGEEGAAVQPSLCDLVGPARDLRACAEAAEAQLRALSEALKETPCVYELPDGAQTGSFYYQADVDALLTRFRSIVDGKD